MKRCFNRILNQRQFFSTHSLNKSYLGYLFCINATNSSSIVIKPGWTDSYTVDHELNATTTNAPSKADDLNVQESAEEDEMVTISSTSRKKLILTTPQQVDLHVEAGSGGLSILGKVEGNCDLSSKGDSPPFGLTSGEISIANTIRGETVNISATERGGSVTIAKVIEATSMQISAHQNVRALRLLGESISVTSGGSLRIGALYSSRSVLSAHRKDVDTNNDKDMLLSVENMHGHAEVNGTGGSINISGVTGSVFVNHKGSGSVALQIDSARGKSTVKSIDGSVTVQIARPVSPMTLILSSFSSIHMPETNQESDVLFSVLQRTFSNNQETITVTLSPVTKSALKDKFEDEKGNGDLTDQASGGSGKIRDGSPITGFYFSKDSSSLNQLPKNKTSTLTSTSEALPVIDISAKGPIIIELPSFIELVRNKTLRNKN